VPSCSCPNDLDRVFGPDRARSDARDYRRHGLDRRSGVIRDFLVSRDIAGRTVLEIGGGIGALQIDLLRAGAAHTENVEISTAYEESARALAGDLGLTERMSRRVGDFAADATAVADADAVILHRVVCCYPHLAALVRPAAGHAKRWLILTFPTDRWWIRFGVAVQAAVMRAIRSRFRFYFHEPREIEAIGREAGLRRIFDRRGLFWEILAMERT
jgi:magnesium-protoporphyrin O-methyltransferase